MKRLPIFFFLLWFLVCEIQLAGKELFPVDASFMVADLKYSEKHGVKICEVQHGILSTFKGDKFCNQGGKIPGNLYKALSPFHVPSWAVLAHIKSKDIKEIFEKSSHWHVKKKLKEVVNDPKFLLAASQPVEDPSDLSKYHGFLFTHPTFLHGYENFKRRYPGIVVLDAATAPYWLDKYKMSLLFIKNPKLASYKPKWGVYSKKYSKELVEQINLDIPGENCVIKPRGAFLGKGVIIVSKQDLDQTLNYILTQKNKLKKDPDPSYNYWAVDGRDSFIVEEFFESDPLSVPHMENKVYQPTMRIAFVLIHNQNTIEVKFLGGYWMLPFHSLSDEGGTLNERHKAYCKPPHYCKIHSDTLTRVEAHLREAFTLLYQEMLIGL